MSMQQVWPFNHRTVTVIKNRQFGGTAAAAPPPSGLATLPSVGAVP